MRKIAAARLIWKYSMAEIFLDLASIAPVADFASGTHRPVRSPVLSLPQSMSINPGDKKAIGIGIALGLAFGVALHNLALGILIGVAIGAGLAASARRKNR